MPCARTLGRKNGFMRGSRNYQATAVFEHSVSQAHTKAVASVANQPSMKGHFDAACAKENDCILAQLPPFFSLGRGSGELTDADISATGFVHCLAYWPPTLTPPYRKSEILARSLCVCVCACVCVHAREHTRSCTRMRVYVKKQMLKQL